MTFAAGCCVGILGAGVIGRLWERFRLKAFAKIAARETGEQRRGLAPPDVDIAKGYLPGCVEAEVAASKPLVNERGFVTLLSGENIFYQTWAPPSGEVRGVVVLFHGFGDHCDFMNSLKAMALCNSGPFAAMSFDQVGHGRSDGSFVYVTDWHAFVDSSREVLVSHLRPMIAKRWPGAKVFGFGESMGGGVLFTLLARERELLDGAILVCPMLFVSRDVFPPWIVVQIFKHVLARILPEWPIAPNKDLKHFMFKDPRMKRFIEEEAEYHSKLSYGAPPRLATASQLAFNAGEWMQSKMSSFDVPSLIIHGGGDQVTDHRVSRALFETMASKDKEFMFPEGIWHADLFHGGPTMREGTQERLSAVASWMEKRC